VGSVEETFFEGGVSNTGVEGSRGIIQQVGVDSTGKGKTGLLTTGQVGTTFEVSGEGSSTDSTLKMLVPVGLPEVMFSRTVEDWIRASWGKHATEPLATT
jgi:hypothetical protein